jgi:hypothetical protein
MMALTLADLDRVKSARASGLKRARYEDGREVEWVSGAEFEKLVQWMERELAVTKTRNHSVAGF